MIFLRGFSAKIQTIPLIQFPAAFDPKENSYSTTTDNTNNDLPHWVYNFLSNHHSPTNHIRLHSNMQSENIEKSANKFDYPPTKTSRCKSALRRQNKSKGKKKQTVLCICRAVPQRGEINLGFDFFYLICRSVWNLTPLFFFFFGYRGCQ